MEEEEQEPEQKQEIEYGAEQEAEHEVQQETDTELVDHMHQVQMFGHFPSDLSDETVVGRYNWRLLKKFALDEKYQEQNWYHELEYAERRLLEQLRELQIYQGNWEPLKPF